MTKNKIIELTKKTKKFVRYLEKGGLLESPFFIYMVLLNYKKVTINVDNETYSLDAVNFSKIDKNAAKHIEFLYKAPDRDYYLYLLENALKFHHQYKKIDGWEGMKLTASNKVHIQTLASTLDGFGYSLKSKALFLQYGI